MIKTIVVGYDDSASSRRALERAAMLAQAFESQLIVTSATPVTASPGRSLGADPVEDAATGSSVWQPLGRTWKSRGCQPNTSRRWARPASRS